MWFGHQKKNVNERWLVKNDHGWQAVKSVHFLPQHLEMITKDHTGLGVEN